MPPEGVAPLAAAAARKREQTHARADAALRDLAERGHAISFQAVARHGRVSRQWLYRQPDLRAEIQRLRAVSPQGSSQVPPRERSTEASLRQRVETLLDENRRMRAENRDLQAELALAYGRQRDADADSPPGLR